ncbi:hypothetical protein BKA62DRAFT_809878 [Auriculariales sp. MPI-PUGE-AT-0066]|nr:hypothetical protein BKA62DRAFT_809878 [Auriculariales sp. MPI-PUGE-AT-0066]
MSYLARFLPFGAGGTAIKKTAVVLRSDLGHDPSVDAAQTLTAFSPDILPLRNGVERGDIAESFQSFSANPLHAGTTNDVWIRAKSFGATSASVSLHEIPNELVLWPQTWAGAPSLGDVTLSAVPGAPSDILVSEEPIAVSQKTHEGGAHSTLLAISGGVGRNNAVAPRNWRQLVDVLGAEESIAAYNILSVEPSQEEHELCTRLRIFEDERDSVELRLSLEAIGVPKVGLEGSLEVLEHDGSTLFSIPRTSLKPNQPAPSVTVRLPAGFDGHVKVKLVKAPDASVCDYASVSVVCTALRSDGTIALLGAEHILFDSAVGLKKYCDVRMEQFANSNFYFRAFMGEGAPPRRRNYAFSPDIQPNGQQPDSNPGSTFANFNTDVASSRGNKIVPNTSNFIYTRVTAQRATSATARLMAVPSRMLLYPNQYHKFSVWDVVWDKGAGRQREDVAYRGFSSNGPGQIVIPSPFDYFQPPAPAL